MVKRWTRVLEARIQSFELAYRMQMEADAFDISNEPQHIKDMYGEVHMANPDRT